MVNHQMSNNLRNQLIGQGFEGKNLYGNAVNEEGARNSKYKDSKIFKGVKGVKDNELKDIATLGGKLKEWDQCHQLSTL